MASLGESFLGRNDQGWAILSGLDATAVCSHYGLLEASFPHWRTSKETNLMNATVSIFTEIPETLHESLKNYLETHPDWDQNRVLTAALSLFLLQNGDSDRRAARVYLETLFHHC